MKKQLLKCASQCKCSSHLNEKQNKNTHMFASNSNDDQFRKKSLLKESHSPHHKCDAMTFNLLKTAKWHGFHHNYMELIFPLKRNYQANVIFGIVRLCN